ncbi:ZIP family metal transporter [Priestia koreensis]|uniref:ZIP family metal transporter n=1 Tax=Priestia koreensis TaxID=284581 RepID=UPI0028F73E4A|nr:ZIP family metal transporter [Priestia koreensis]
MNIGILFSSLCTVLGALPALLFRNVSHRIKDNLLAYSAGIMVAASTYALIPSTLKLSNIFVLTCGILLGTVALTLLESCLPHADLNHSAQSARAAGPLLVIASMAIHNIPEGISVGISYSSPLSELGNLVSFSIGLQNIPEGFLICLFLVMNGVPKQKAIALSAFTAVIELSSSYIGLQLSDQFLGIVPYGLAFAAGSMLFVVYKELIPESHGDGNARSATFSFVGGLLSMIIMIECLK